MNSIVVVILSGLSIGILGSFHCIGMCGPLALTLPVQQLNGSRKTIAILLYNIGRALSYAIMGAIFGLLGSSFALFNLQQWLSILAGSFILIVLLLSQFGGAKFPIINRYTNAVKSKLTAYLVADKKLHSYLSIGILNGFLPCGLVYMAIAASIATGSVFESSLLMLSFGLGTLPIMALTMAFGKFISTNVRVLMSKASPYIIMCVAILLIVRGLNLGIPYVSPKHEQGHVNCCEPR